MSAADAELTAALADLAQDTSRRPVLIALDFDGTLAPLIDNPDDSTMLPVAADAVGRLASSAGVTVALVSGRSLTDLQRRSQAPEGCMLIGSHGGEKGHISAYGLEREPIRLEPEQADLLTRIGAGLTAAARGRDGVWVQHKPAGAVLHTRMAAADDAAAATEQALALAKSLGVDALHGKDVVEVAVLRVDKGRALADLRRELGSAVVLYAGDDTTDEFAFEVLGESDLAVKIGTGDSAARLRSADPRAFSEALAAFAEMFTP